MITRDELNALTQLLQRAPMSHAEALWVQVLLLRLQAGLVQQEILAARPGGATGAGTQGQEQEKNNDDGDTLDRAAAPDALPADVGDIVDGRRRTIPMEGR